MTPEIYTWYRSSNISADARVEARFANVSPYIITSGQAMNHCDNSHSNAGEPQLKKAFWKCPVVS